MIVFDVQTVARNCGATTAYALIRDAGLSPAVAARVWKGENQARLELSILNRLCAAFNCQPGDILKYVPDKQKPKTLAPALKASQTTKSNKRPRRK